MSTKNKFRNPEKQRELLLSGQYNTLFNDLTLDLPFRFYCYAAPESLVGLFADLHIRLSKATNRRGKSDVWIFDDVIKIIAPYYIPKSWGDTVRYLVNHCKIPEGHINFSNERIIDGHMLPVRRIYLSRYAMCLVINDLLRDSKSLDEDLGAELFKVPSQKPAVDKKDDFRNEMRAAYAGYFFSHPEAECEEIMDVTWDYVRGKRLKTRYENALKELAYAARYRLGKNLTPQKFYHVFEEFKQECIFDVLFKTPDVGTFKEQYEAVLQKLGYRLAPNSADNIRWRNGKRTAPKYPGAFFAPHVTFLLTWTIKAFCEFVREEDQTKRLGPLAKNFFAVIKDGVTAAKRECANTIYDFTTMPLFTDKHHSEARKATQALKHGTGENPSLLEFWKQQTLFCEDDKVCLTSRKYAEVRLRKLHEQYSKDPGLGLTLQITNAEQDIAYENMGIYGFNFQPFVEVPETLGLDGILRPRAIQEPETANTIFYIPKRQSRMPQPVRPITQSAYPMIDFDNPIVPVPAQPVRNRYDAFTLWWCKGVKEFMLLNPLRPDARITKGHSTVRSLDNVMFPINRVLVEWDLPKNQFYKYDKADPTVAIPFENDEERQNYFATYDYAIQPLLKYAERGVSSGNKSLQFTMLSDITAKTPVEYRLLCAAVFDYVDEIVRFEWKGNRILVDRNNNKACGLMRAPGIVRQSTGRLQELIAQNDNPALVPIDPKRLLPKPPPQMFPRVIENSEHNRNQKINYLIRRRDELEPGKQSALLPSILNSGVCGALNLEEIHDLLDDFLEKEHWKYIDTLYDYRNSR